MKHIKTRPKDQAIYDKAVALGCSPAVANLLSRRAVPLEQLEQVIQPHLKDVPSPFLLLGIEQACERLVKAIQHKERIGVLTDYDVDGITSHAVIFQALTQYFGVSPDLVQPLIGHRLEDGYGVSASLVDKILDQPVRPQVIITADCGSSDEDRLKRLKEAGIEVIVTDHHGIGEKGVPESALVTVNPVQIECAYPDKNIAGCMVSWLVMSALRQRLVEQGVIENTTPKLSQLLDYVALGTVADAVSLGSPVNRAVVKAGLKVMNQCERSAWRALKIMLNKETFIVDDLGFQIGPRINARGRLAEPGIALTFLIANDDAIALSIVQHLDEHNQERKKIERAMVVLAKQHAIKAVDKKAVSVVSFHDDFHPGVQGIVASRIVENFGRVCAVLSPTLDIAMLCGSVRSIEGVHVRQALARVHQQHPHLLISFGGHAGAAGLKLLREHVAAFRAAFEEAVMEQLTSVDLAPIVWTDGAPQAVLSLDFLSEMNVLLPFGRGFASPLFEDGFEIKNIDPMGQPAVHLSLRLLNQGKVYQAVWFNALPGPDYPLPFGVGDSVQCAFKVQENVYQGCSRLQLLVECMQLVDRRVFV